MAELGGRAAEAAVRAAAADDAAADACAEREHQHLARAHTGAVGVLADGRRRGVVVERDGHAEGALELVAQGHVTERQVDRVHDRAGVVVDARGDADADGIHGPGRRDQPRQALLDPAQACFRRRDVGGGGEPLQHCRRLHADEGASARLRQAPAQERRGHLGAPDIDADDRAFRLHRDPQLTMV